MMRRRIRIFVARGKERQAQMTNIDRHMVQDEDIHEKVLDVVLDIRNGVHGMIVEDGWISRSL
jgi:hypothetical protein